MPFILFQTSKGSSNRASWLSSLGWNEVPISIIPFAEGSEFVMLKEVASTRSDCGDTRLVKSASHHHTVLDVSFMVFGSEGVRFKLANGADDDGFKTARAFYKELESEIGRK